MRRTTFLTLKLSRDHWYWTGIAGAAGLIAVLAVLQLQPAIPVASGEHGEVGPYAQIGRPAPDFTLTTPEGQTFSLSSLRGRPVILYFWTSWCSFCRDEMPALNATFETQGYADDLVVLGINILEDASTVRHYLQGLGVSFPVLLDENGTTAQKYLVRALPSYYFIDREGILRSRIIGIARPGQFRARLESIAKPPNSPTSTGPRATPRLL